MKVTREQMVLFAAEHAIADLLGAYDRYQDIRPRHPLNSDENFVSALHELRTLHRKMTKTPRKEGSGP